MDLSENEIAECHGLDSLPVIAKLVLTKNKLTSLHDFPVIPSLEHLVLTENQLAEFKTIENLVKF